MGAPKCYSSELIERLDFLIRNLLPCVQKGIEGDRKFGGRLSTTFLLAMATPMIVLPTERVLKADEGKKAMAHDSSFVVTEKFRKLISSNVTFGKSALSSVKKWSYVRGYNRFDIGQPWPESLLDALSMDQAYEDAANISARQMVSDLRNALSHGGVTYLNRNGHHIHGDQAEMFGFAATERQNGNTFNIIRVPEDEFCTFLIRWATLLTP